MQVIPPKKRKILEPLFDKIADVSKLTGEGSTPVEPTPIGKTQDLGVETASNNSMTTQPDSDSVISTN